MNRPLDQIVDAIYDAATDPPSWQEVLESIADRLGGHQAVLCSLDKREPRRNFAISARTDPAMLQRYTDHYHRTDNWVARALGVADRSSHTGEMLVPKREFERSEHYVDFLRPQGIYHMSCCAFTNDRRQLNFLSVMRPRGRRAFGRQTLETLDRLTPHLRRALRIQQRIGGESLGGIGRAELPDALSCPLLVVDEALLLAYANPAAWGLLERREGLGVSRGRVKAVEPRDRETLRAAVAAVAGKRDEEPGGSQEVLAVSRGPEHAPLRLVAVRCTSRLRAIAGADRSPGTPVCLLVLDPGSAARTGFDHLQLRYRLTPAERRFLEAFLSCCAVKEAAERVSITEGSARIYLKRIFAKVGVTSQPQLVKRLLQECPGILPG